MSSPLLVMNGYLRELEFISGESLQPAADVDLILMCTSNREDLCGSAPQIQEALGCQGNPLSYDITAACSGFLLGLISASCHIRGGGFRNVLVIGADALSRFVDWTDRGSRILFGDAAGAGRVLHLFWGRRWFIFGCA